MSKSFRIHGYAGFSLIEVLIALVITTIGLLGLAALQARAQQAEMESYQRAQALILLEDMVNRLNANRKTADCYAITDLAQGTPYVGAGNTTTYTCTSYGVEKTQSVANADLAAWDALLKGAAETLNSNSAGAMIGARGCISYDAANEVFIIAVAWQGLADTAVPASNCGKDLYGAETRRRVLSTAVRLADLD